MIRLTRAQMTGLRRLWDGLNWADGIGRAGGATRRMMNHLVAAGLLTKTPYEITAKGAKALFENLDYAKHRYLKFHPWMKGRL